MSLRPRSLCALLLGLACPLWIGLAPVGARAVAVSYHPLFGVDPLPLGSLGGVLGLPNENGVRMWSLSDDPDDPTAPVNLLVDGIRINSWRIQMKEDPWVTNNINVTNTTAAVQSFTATVVLPIPAFLYDSIISSSFGVTITDSSGNASMSYGATGSTPLYQGTINGSTELMLGLPAAPLTTADCDVPNTGGCSATDSNGVPFLASGPAVATSIGIILSFDLSPGDSVGITSRFEIVPEPGTVLLLGMGLAGLTAAGRRRH